MRRTKSFSYDDRDKSWFERLAREADREGRSESSQLISVLKNFFETKRMIRNINRRPRPNETVPCGKRREP